MKDFINKSVCETTFLDKYKDADFRRVSTFIMDAEKNDITAFNYFEDMVKGAMLLNAFFLQEDIDNPIEMKFKETKIFFDTTFLYNLLGYGGDEKKVQCSELIQLLRKTKAQLKYFSHTLSELEGIFDALIISLKTGAKSYRFEYFYQKEYNDADAIRLKVGSNKTFMIKELILKRRLTFLKYKKILAGRN